MPDLALADLVVAECGQGLAVAFCSKILADLGADVIKVEPPEGDASRRRGPFPQDVPDPEKSGQFLYLNANKRGVTLDLEVDQGRQVLTRLFPRADILVTDFPPKALEAKGLDYPSIQFLNPQLIAAYITPFGLTGPYRDYKGSDLIAWHMGGAGVGTPHQAVTDLGAQQPLRGGGFQADYLAGWTAATAIMAAVFYRHTYDVGQMVDVSAMEAVANMVRPDFARYSYDRPSVASPRPKASLPWIFPCKDGYISTSTNRDHWWEALKDLMGRPDWADSPAFKDMPSRRLNSDALELLLTQWYMQHTRQELYRMLVAKGIPCFPVNTIQEVVSSPQYAAWNFFVEQDHPAAGRIKQPGPFVRYSETPWTLRRPAPLLGQHNEEVFCRLFGLDMQELNSLKQAGVV
ncbi:MAG: CoA transferase [Chloroflexi bacterium]|nr:CoA transferase [Chloroflexota bacterium]